jgi:surface antigen
MNGDGLLDRMKKNDTCYYPYDNCPWSVYFNNGSGFDASPISWRNPSPWDNIRGTYIRNTDSNGAFTDVMDINGDGLPDRIVYSRNCTYPYTNCPWKVYFNNGSGFDPGVDWSNPSPWDFIRGNYIRNTDLNGISTDVVDINGDGLPDRVVFNRNCGYPFTNCPWKVYFNNGVHAT